MRTLQPHYSAMRHVSFSLSSWKPTLNLPIAFSPECQNRKYRCASGSVCAGGQVRCSPSAVTW